MQRNSFVEGDRIRIKKKSDSGVVVYEGVAMPTASRNVVIKLDSGYNIGIRQENMEIEVIERGGRLKTEKELKEGAAL